MKPVTPSKHIDFKAIFQKVKDAFKKLFHIKPKVVVMNEYSNYRTYQAYTAQYNPSGQMIQPFPTGYSGRFLVGITGLMTPEEREKKWHKSFDDAINVTPQPEPPKQINYESRTKD